MIQSGRLTPGIVPAAWSLPVGTALRFERPAAPLRPLFPSYAVYDWDRTVWSGAQTYKLPGWPQIWIVLADGPIGASVRNRTYAALGSAMLWGSTSQAIPVTTDGGVSV